MKVGAYHNIPYSKWFSNCFADVLPETTFVRVWDKVMSGSTMVLVYIAVFTIIINRRPILVMKTTSKILEIFTQIKTDTADEIVRRGIELWQRNGGKLTPSNMRASPAVGTDRSPTPTLFYSSNA
ncbi:hypothetical protein EB796_002460 [Bugula neritina]|uniref:Uncharacterized protein n=1 Tax=Bugula neritina TaxID=10212 RepID=A0A7J7KM79_BUGNE|nr:hypothetical protein EB796_002460 [Bugula neritina]